MLNINLTSTFPQYNRSRSCSFQNLETSRKFKYYCKNCVWKHLDLENLLNRVLDGLMKLLLKGKKNKDKYTLLHFHFNRPDVQSYMSSSIFTSSKNGTSYLDKWGNFTLIATIMMKNRAATLDSKQTETNKSKCYYHKSHGAKFIVLWFMRITRIRWKKKYKYLKHCFRLPNAVKETACVWFGCHQWVFFYVGMQQTDNFFKG